MANGTVCLGNVQFTKPITFSGTNTTWNTDDLGKLLQKMITQIDALWGETGSLWTETDNLWESKVDRAGSSGENGSSNGRPSWFD